MKRVISVVLILAMALSLAACGGDKSSSDAAVLSGDVTSGCVNGVTADVGSFVLDGEAPLSVKKLETVGDADAGWSVEPYEIAVGDLHELNDYITIRIPYSADSYR